MKMDTSSLVDDAKWPVKTQLRTSLFFNKYRYRTTVCHSPFGINFYALKDRLNRDISPGEEYKLVVAFAKCHIYTNDWELATNLDQYVTVSSGKKKFITTQVSLLDGPAGAVLLKNSPYNMRSYFKETKLSIEDRGRFTKFLTSQLNIRLSPALGQFIASSSRRWLYRSHFIDHNDDAILVMLNLITPGLIRQTHPISTYK